MKNGRFKSTSVSTGIPSQCFEWFLTKYFFQTIYFNIELFIYVFFPPWILVFPCVAKNKRSDWDTCGDTCLSFCLLLWTEMTKFPVVLCSTSSFPGPYKRRHKVLGTRLFPRENGVATQWFLVDILFVFFRIFSFKPTNFQYFISRCAYDRSARACYRIQLWKLLQQRGQSPQRGTAQKGRRGTKTTTRENGTVEK